MPSRNTNPGADGARKQLNEDEARWRRNGVVPTVPYTGPFARRRHACRVSSAIGLVEFCDVRKALPRRIPANQPRRGILTRDLKDGSFSVVLYPILCHGSAENRKCLN